MTWLVPYTVASVDYVDTSTDSRLRIWNVRPVVARPDYPTAERRSSAPQQVRCAACHVGFGWFGPGLSLATLYSLRHCLGVFCLDAPSARCLLLVVLCATVVKLESRKNMPKAFAWLQWLGCTSYFWWYNVVLFIEVSLFSKRQGISIWTQNKAGAVSF